MTIKTLPAQPKVGMVSLGCPKALVDSERILTKLRADGYGLSPDYAGADVVLVNTLLAQLFRPLDMLGMVYRTIRQGLIDMEAMFRLIDTPSEITDAPGAPALHVAGGAVAFEDVVFGYEPDRTILNGVSFAVGAGETLAIVGPSGAGKSTLVKLLLRFYDPEGGRILIDGQDITIVRQDSLRQAIGMVQQDNALLHRSIRENILYGRPTATEAEVIAAAKQAQAHDFIQDFNDQGGRSGYDAQVGERGVKLSGGQRQRIALARVILKNAPILLLDEATSALDSEVEAAIQQTLYGMMEGKTVIAIAHRLSTIAEMDRILVMDGGRIVEEGTHEVLLAQGGLYADFWNRQSGGFLRTEEPTS